MNDTNHAMDSLEHILRALGLQVMQREAAAVTTQAEQQNWGYRRFLQHLADLEVAERLSRRIALLLKRAEIPREFTLARLDQTRVPEKPRRLLPTLLTGDFVRRGDNLLCFGLPGRGKSFYCGAICRELIQQHEMKTWFVPSYKLVSQLLLVKSQHQLPQTLERLGKLDAICIDDIGYVQHTAEEMEVLFTFLAERHQQQKTVMVTSNLVFSQWDQIFKNPMTAMAAVDRLVHRSVILEFERKKSNREEEAEQRLQV
jgi:DNA replication protein DnaC